MSENKDGNFTEYGVKAYKNVSIETQVKSGSPHALILMLYDALLDALGRAKIHMESKEFANKGKACSHAIRLINEGLRVSLNHEAGKEVAANLDALYDYMLQRILRASADNDTKPLMEVITITQELKDAWLGIKPAPAAKKAAARKSPFRGKL